MENSTLEKVTREQRKPVIELKTEANCVKESVLQLSKKADETLSEIFAAINKKNENKKPPPCSMVKMNVESPICIPYSQHSNASSLGHPILTSSGQWQQSFRTQTLLFIIIITQTHLPGIHIHIVANGRVSNALVLKITGLFLVITIVWG